MDRIGGDVVVVDRLRLSGGGSSAGSDHPAQWRFNAVKRRLAVGQAADLPATADAFDLHACISDSRPSHRWDAEASAYAGLAGIGQRGTADPAAPAALRLC